MTQMTCFRISKYIKCDVLQPFFLFFKGCQQLQRCSSESIVRLRMPLMLFKNPANIPVPWVLNYCQWEKRHAIFWRHLWLTKSKLSLFPIWHLTPTPPTTLLQKTCWDYFSKKRLEWEEKAIYSCPFFFTRPIGNCYPFISDMGISRTRKASDIICM